MVLQAGANVRLLILDRPSWSMYHRAHRNLVLPMYQLRQFRRVNSYFFNFEMTGKPEILKSFFGVSPKILKNEKFNKTEFKCVFSLFFGVPTNKLNERKPKWGSWNRLDLLWPWSYLISSDLLFFLKNVIKWVRVPLSVKFYEQLSSLLIQKIQLKKKKRNDHPPTRPPVFLHNKCHRFQRNIQRDPN